MCVLVLLGGGYSLLLLTNLTVSAVTRFSPGDTKDTDLRWKSLGRVFGRVSQLRDGPAGEVRDGDSKRVVASPRFS